MQALAEIADGWLLAAVYVLGALAIGLVLERVVAVWLRHQMDRNPLWTPDAVLDAIKGVLTELSVLVGVRLALNAVELGAAEETIKDVLFVLLVLVLTVVVSRLGIKLLDAWLARTEGAVPSTSIFTNIIRVIVFVIGALIVLEHFGIAITPILTALGVGGLAVALALQETLSNLFAGLQIIASRQVRPGDYIKLVNEDVEGDVVDVSWRNTTVRALANNDIVIPNSKLANSIVTNYQLPERELSILVQVGVSYDSDLEKVERVTCETATATMHEIHGGVGEFAPFIRYHTFGDSSIGFTVILRAREFKDQYLITHDFVKRLHRRFDEEGIEIPFPIRTVHLRGGATAEGDISANG